MDQLLICAKSFEHMLSVKYHITIGRKGKSVKLTIGFEAVEFHHLIGLHKLRDLRLSRANREKIFYQIIRGDITLDDIKKSRYFSSIQQRLEPFSKIESLFDKNEIIFRYNQKLQSFSFIEAEYLLSTPYEHTDIYIFLDHKDKEEEFFCRSFFPKEDKDYTKNQAVYTLLKKEKENIQTGSIMLQYNRLSHKPKGKPIH